MKHHIHQETTSDEVVLVSFMLAINGSRIRYACGHMDHRVLIIKVPERLYDLCRSKGWLHRFNSWDAVVVFHHRNTERGGIKAFGFENDSCSACFILKLKRELAVLDAAGAGPRVNVKAMTRKRVRLTAHRQ